MAYLIAERVIQTIALASLAVPEIPYLWLV